MRRPWLPVPIFWGIFPQIIYGDKAYEKGSMVCGLDFDVKTGYITGLSDENADHLQQISSFFKEAKACDSLMIFVDGNSKYIARLIEQIYGFFANKINYFGGGAGTLRLRAMPCLYTKSRIVSRQRSISCYKEKNFCKR